MDPKTYITWPSLGGLSLKALCLPSLLLAAASLSAGCDSAGSIPVSTAAADTTETDGGTCKAADCPSDQSVTSSVTSKVTSKVIKSGNGKNGAVFAETNGAVYLYMITGSSIARYTVGGSSSQVLDATWGTDGFAALPSSGMKYLLSCGGTVWSLESGTTGKAWRKLAFSDTSPFVTVSSPQDPVIPDGFAPLNFDTAHCVDNQFLATGQLGSRSLVVYDAFAEVAVGSYDAGSTVQAANYQVVPLRKTNGDWVVVQVNEQNSTNLIELPAPPPGSSLQSFDYDAAGLTTHSIFSAMEVQDVAIDNRGAFGTQSQVGLVRSAVDTGGTNNAKLKITFQTANQMITHATTSGYSFDSNPDIEYVTASFDGTNGPNAFDHVFACVTGGWFTIAGWGTRQSDSTVSWLNFGIDGSGSLDGAFNNGQELILSRDPFNAASGISSASVACGTGGSTSEAFAYASGSPSLQSTTTNVLISP